MRLLLDTHVFLWWIDDAPQLSAAARRAISNAANSCFFSVASCWEIAIKLSLGKLKLATAAETMIPEVLAAHRFELLPIEFRHVMAVASLPFHHRDPFDRLLAGQASVEGMAIVSNDAKFAAYGVKRIG